MLPTDWKLDLITQQGPIKSTFQSDKSAIWFYNMHLHKKGRKERKLFWSGFLEKIQIFFSTIVLGLLKGITEYSAPQCLRNTSYGRDGGLLLSEGSRINLPWFFSAVGKLTVERIEDRSFCTVQYFRFEGSFYRTRLVFAMVSIQTLSPVILLSSSLNSLAERLAVPLVPLLVSSRVSRSSTYVKKFFRTFIIQ